MNGSAIHVSGNELAMPMQLFGSIGIVVYFYGDRLAFFEAQQRAWKLAVVGDGRNDVFGGDLNWTCDDSQDIIWRAVWRIGAGLRRGDVWRARRRHSREAHGTSQTYYPGACGRSRHGQKITARCEVLTHGCVSEIPMILV